MDERLNVFIKGIRPFILSQDSFKILDELRGFRHVFRHAYSYALDNERLIMLAEKTLKLKELFQIDFDGFKNKLINEW